MVLRMFAIYDVTTGFYLPPLFCHNAGHALRVFSDVFKNPESVYFKHPECFRVDQIGDFNDQDGSLNGIKPVYLATGCELLGIDAKGGTDATVATG